MEKPPRLNIIYDCRRSEKYEPLIQELNRQNITDFEIFPCLMYPSVVFSINASHKMIVAKAKKEGLVEVCIGEDDLMLPHENGWKWFLKNKPPVYDLYVSGNYMAFERPKHSGSFRVNHVVGFHLYMVHSRYYDTFLATPDDQHIDSAQKSPLMYCCYPFAALQRPGFSSNNLAMVNYNSILSSEDIYQ